MARNKLGLDWAGWSISSPPCVIVWLQGSDSTHLHHFRHV